MAETKEYAVTIYFADSKEIKVRARNREEAIEKASKRSDRLGLDVTTLRVPFLEGDE